jgi:vancomycin resistance protein YoaR
MGQMSPRRRRDRYRHGGPWAKSHGRVRRFVVPPVVVIGGTLSVLLIAWAIDSRVHSGQPPRGTTIDGRSVSGETADQLRAEVASIASGWAAVPVKITTPKGALDTTLGALGIAVDQKAAFDGAVRAGDDQFVLARPFLWAKSVVVSEPVPVRFTVDDAAAGATLAELEAANRVDPVEPGFEPADDKVSVRLVASKPGEALDRAAILRQAVAAAESGQRAITIDARPVVRPPTFTDAEAEKLLDQANQMTKKSVSIYLNDRSLRIDTKTLLTWLKLAPAAGGGIDIQVDEAKVANDVPRLLGVQGVPVAETGFVVGFDGQPAIVDGKPGTRCCTPESIQKIPAALKAGTQRVDLEMAVAFPQHDRAWAEGLQITTRVADFTTPHPCCQPRVTNIHRIADTVRGAIIPPGETYSLNAHVGQRTKEKGYVEAPVIYDGTSTSDVGGGVSQFAATLFNAAFFGGLDIPAYQMHSQYISRYPYGREATISWDKPDLKIRNNTPYGVLIWTTYTDTSVTVALYSTPWVKGDQTNQTRSQRGACTAVTTERTRTFLADNRTETDTFNALYQPADGVTC